MQDMDRQKVRANKYALMLFHSVMGHTEKNFSSFWPSDFGLWVESNFIFFNKRWIWYHKSMYVYRKEFLNECVTRK